MELAICVKMGIRQIFDDMLRCPIAAGHDRSSGFQSIHFSSLRVGNGHAVSFGWIPVMLYPDGGGSETNASGGACAVESPPPARPRRPDISGETETMPADCRTVGGVSPAAG